METYQSLQSLEMFHSYTTFPSQGALIPLTRVFVDSITPHLHKQFFNTERRPNQNNSVKTKNHEPIQDPILFFSSTSFFLSSMFFRLLLNAFIILFCISKKTMNNVGYHSHLELSDLYVV